MNDYMKRVLFRYVYGAGLATYIVSNGNNLQEIVGMLVLALGSFGMELKKGKIE